MAAHLVEMKSFLLLPRSEEGERMKQELTGQLIEYDQCRRMAPLLRAKGEAAPVFVRRPMEVEWDNTYALHHAPQILADYWQALAGRTKTRRVPTQQQFEPLVTAPMVSVTSRVVYILRRMLGGTVAKMEQLFSPQPEPQHQRSYLSGTAGTGARRTHRAGRPGSADHAPHPPGTQ